MKKYIALFALLFTVAFAFASQSFASDTYSDLDKAPWAEEEILYLTSENIIDGYPDGRFGPNDPLTRNQAVKMLVYDLYPNVEPTSNPGFPDVSTSNFYYEMIAVGFEKGLINGYPDGTFRGKDQITRAEAAHMLDNAYDISRGLNNGSFPDVRGLWAEESITDLASKNYINGYPDGTFKPGEPISRAEFSKMLAGILDNSVRVISIK
ncbi:S-layer homology domain-containing protein [Halobacillus fulvus]|nr:S-layer homology domain-containing protein [Halobacillus fulvus]